MAIREPNSIELARILRYAAETLINNNKNYYEAGVRFARAAKHWDTAGEYANAHQDEDNALWCLWEICKQLECAKFDDAVRLIRQISDLSNEISKPDLEIVSRWYA